jgi:hypothetical protein
MEQPEKIRRNFQDKLVDHIVNGGHTIGGSYVYKTLVNGDPSSDIDVKVTSYNEMEKLCNEMETLFKCQRSRITEEPISIGLFRYGGEGMGNALQCPYSVNGRTEYERVEMIMPLQRPSNPVFNLEYKQVDGKPQIVNCDGNNEEAQRTIQQLQNRQFASWSDMRPKDKVYFSKPQWTDTSSWSFKMSNFFKSDKE